MAARDKYHAEVRQALEADGWTVTADPLRVDVGRRTILIDLAAERDGELIAVEIKTFEGMMSV